MPASGPPCASLSRLFGCCVACTRLLLLAISLDCSLLFLSGDRFFLRWVTGFPHFHLCSTTYHKFHYYDKKNIVLLPLYKEPKKKKTYLLIYGGLGLLHATLSGGRYVGCRFLCILGGLHFRSF
jgi:hypothetical protein